MGADIYLKSTKGYFRDSYNDSSLFGVLGLSWWRMADKGSIDSNGLMQVPDMVELKQTLDGTTITRDMLNTHAPYLMGVGNDQDLIFFFTGKKTELSNLLEEAIKRNEPLYCSV